MTIMMDVLAVAAAIKGQVHGENRSICRVVTDSRAAGSGDLFIALRGEHFDGHDYLEVAAAKGAVAAVVSGHAVDRLKPYGMTLISVADTRFALGELAANWRDRFDLPLIAVTGSNGKTTTKGMIASILVAVFGESQVLSTQGNLNNDIGLPMTLLQLNAGHRAAVIEMGMNHPGEIAALARIARPTVALVTNAQRAHLAGMGTLETIAAEKGSVFLSLGPDGVAVFSADDSWGELWCKQSAEKKRLCYSLGSAADVAGTYQAHGLDSRLTITARGRQVDVLLALPGIHNARNALGAAAAALAAGISLEAVASGLSSFRGIKGRLERRPGIHGAIVLDDTYNANPDSVRAGIDVLAATVGKKILVLGDMGEIGEMTGQFHDEVGGYAKSQGVDSLLAFGDSSALAAKNFGSGGRHFKKIEALIDDLKAEMTAETTVLIKGSRFMRMERVAEAVSEMTKEGKESCC